MPNQNFSLASYEYVNLLIYVPGTHSVFQVNSWIRAVTPFSVIQIKLLHLYALQQGMFLKPNVLHTGQLLGNGPIPRGFPWSHKIRWCCGFISTADFANSECCFDLKCQAYSFDTLQYRKVKLILSGIFILTSSDNVINLNVQVYFLLATFYSLEL